jgi:hypothetical protein
MKDCNNSEKKASKLGGKLEGIFTLDEMDELYLS